MRIFCVEMNWEKEQKIISNRTIAPGHLNDISEENTRIVLYIAFAIFIVNIVMGIYMELQDKEENENIEEKK